MTDYSSQGQSLVHLHLSCGASTVNRQKTSGILQPWERGSSRPRVGPKCSLFCVGAVIPTGFHFLLVGAKIFLKQDMMTLDERDGYHLQFFALRHYFYFSISNVNIPKIPSIENGCRSFFHTAIGPLHISAAAHNIGEVINKLC